MRGKEEKQYTVKNGKGITPAYAGKSQQFPDRFRFLVDHPRLCGEKANFQPVFVYFLGSPPPMRGKEIAVGLE